MRGKGVVETCRMTPPPPCSHRTYLLPDSPRLLVEELVVADDLAVLGVPGIQHHILQQHVRRGVDRFGHHRGADQQTGRGEERYCQV